jgi:hypothetical protein
MSASRLGSHIRLVFMQFSFSNPSNVPTSVSQLDEEPEDERAAKKSLDVGSIQLIEVTEDVFILPFLNSLEQAGYEMINAFYKNRQDTRSHRFYQMVRFAFARKEFVTISEEFRYKRQIILPDLQKMCLLAMWRVRSYQTPFFRDHNPVPGQYTMSINLEVRNPLYKKDGTPIMIQPKDANGLPVGIARPLVPKKELRIMGDSVEVVTV